MTLIRQLLQESNADGALNAELEALRNQHGDVMADAYPSDGCIYLNTLMARRDAPPGSGSRYMADLCRIADRHQLKISLVTANRDTGLSKRPGPQEFKRTTSGDRLKGFYKRFGFVMNARHGRYDLRGNMFRPAAGRQLYEAEYREEPWRLKLEAELSELESSDPHLEVSLYPTNPTTVVLSQVSATRDAPAGTGTRFMEALCRFADERSLTICLSPGQRGDYKSATHKGTSSTDRLRRFYGRFEFIRNSRTGRYDLPGSMHRRPANYHQHK